MVADLKNLKETIILDRLVPGAAGFLTAGAEAYNQEGTKVEEVVEALVQLETAGLIVDTGNGTVDEPQYRSSTEGFLERERILRKRQLRRRCLLEQTAHSARDLVLAIAMQGNIQNLRGDYRGFLGAPDSVCESNLLIYLYRLKEAEVRRAIHDLRSNGLLEQTRSGREGDTVAWTTTFKGKRIYREEVRGRLDLGDDEGILDILMGRRAAERSHSDSTPTFKRLTYDRQIGQGGFADVWRAHDPLLGRDVAVKVFRSTDFVVSDALEHAKALARVTHPNVVVVHEVVEVADPVAPQSRVDAVLMELLEGQRLGDRLDGPPFSVGEARRVGVAILDGIQAIHQAGLVHMDLHDDNVMLDSNVGAKVIDILYRSTMANAATTIRQARFGRDISAVSDILGNIIRHSELEQGSYRVFRQRTLGTRDLDVVRAAFSEAIAMETTGESKPQGVLTAPRPDIRIQVDTATTFGPPMPGRHLVGITIQNHSPVTVYIQSVFIELSDSRMLYPTGDALFGRSLHNLEIESGNSESFPLDPHDIAEKVEGDFEQVLSVLVTDKIGRQYRSDKTRTQGAFVEALGRGGAALDD